MSTKLIVDSGSTKTRWALLTPDGETEIITTPGINPAIMSVDEINEIVAKEVAPVIDRHDIGCVHYYGAGCVSDKICAQMERILIELTECRNVAVSSDLLGAARALCGHSRGIACILGTGSNSCMFDGERIIEHVSPLGFILGDEGSGAVIGRKFIGNVLKRQLPDEIISDFDSQFHLNTAEIIERVYKRPAPNAFLASFMPFVAKHIAHPTMESMITNEFTLFFKRNVMNYGNATTTPLHFTGSVAHHFSQQLYQAASSLGLNIVSIIANPLPDLIMYHKD